MRSVAPLVLAGVALLLHGCAKSPAGITTGFTKITFRMRVAGKINTTVDDDPATSYIYDVAFRATTDLNPPPNLAPLPVINATNPNGRVGGSPTHFVEFNSLNPVTSFPFTLYKFGAGPTVSDPTNPTDLSKWTDTTSTRGPILSFVQYTPGAKEIQFDIFVNQLGDTDAQGAAMQTLMVQFLTMSRYGNVGSGNRAWDAIGTANLPNYIQVDLRSNGHYTNTISGIEGANDVAGGNDPDLDIIDYSIDVQLP